MTTAAHPVRTVWPLRRGDDDPLAFLEGLAAGGAEIVPFGLGRREAFLLNHPARIEDVLVRQNGLFVKGRGYERATRLLGTGLLTASGALHRERRRAAQGAFHRRRLESYLPGIVRHAARCGDRWRADAPLDIAREMRELTLAIAGEALFGADLDPWADAIARAVALALPPMDGLLAIVAPPARTRRARRELDAVIDAIVEARTRSASGSDGACRAGEPSGEGAPSSREAPAAGEDLLAMLLEARADDSPASARQLRDDVLTFLMAGHDTISHALTWTWLLLAAHPDVDRRLGDELAAVLGTRPAEATDVPNLVYTRAIVAEALRLFPPAWVIVRRAVEACRVGGVALPAGAIVVASPFVTHRDPRFFVHPLQFMPERWLPSATGDLPAPPKLAYLPFGAGPRACIGEGFAWLEATLVLATLAQRWRLTRPSSASMDASAQVTLRPKLASPMTATPRL